MKKLLDILHNLLAADLLWAADEDILRKVG
jgi:hypothetical protein